MVEEVAEAVEARKGVLFAEFGAKGCQEGATAGVGLITNTCSIRGSLLVPIWLCCDAIRPRARPFSN